MPNLSFPEWISRESSGSGSQENILEAERYIFHPILDFEQLNG